MEYTHSSPQDRAEFLTARLRAMEVEHHGLSVVVQAAKDAGATSPQQPMLDELERNINAFRKALAELA